MSGNNAQLGEGHLLGLGPIPPVFSGLRDGRGVDDSPPLLGQFGSGLGVTVVHLNVSALTFEQKNHLKKVTFEQKSFEKSYQKLFVGKM